MITTCCLHHKYLSWLVRPWLRTILVMMYLKESFYPNCVVLSSAFKVRQFFITIHSFIIGIPEASVEVRLQTSWWNTGPTQNCFCFLSLADDVFFHFFLSSSWRLVKILNHQALKRHISKSLLFTVYSQEKVLAILSSNDFAFGSFHCNSFV
jgi:hypothetical protein